jgi:hypothetical protein
MAVTSLVVSRENPPTGTSDDRNRGSYTITYDAYCDSSMAPGAVAQGSLAFGLPAQWTGYNYLGFADPTSVVRTYNVRLKSAEKSIYVWTIEVGWQPLEPGEDDQQDDQDPENRGPRFAWDDEFYTKIVDKDLDGKPITNSADQPFDEPLEIEQSRGVLCVSINVGSLGEAIEYSRKFQLAMNKSTWRIGTKSIPPRAALCRSVTSSPLNTESTYTYYTLEFRFAFAEEGNTWDTEILNRGLMEKATVPTPPDSQGNPGEPTVSVRPITVDVKGVKVPITEPVKLDAEGKQLKDGDDPTYQKFRVYREVDYSGLPFNLGS